MDEFQKMQNRRKKLFIEPGFQAGFLAHTLSGAVLSAVVFFLADRYFFWKFSSYGKRAGLPAGHVFFQFLHAQQAQMDRIVLGTALILCSVLLLKGLSYSNRIAGPIFRLRQHLKKHAESGASQELSFRQGDLFQDLVPLVNGALSPSQKRSDERKSA